MKHARLPKRTRTNMNEETHANVKAKINSGTRYPFNAKINLGTRQTSKANKGFAIPYYVKFSTVSGLNKSGYYSPSGCFKIENNLEYF